ncbi:MAG: cyclic nucleotide-binding domain-containing protein [Burkholderiales bacterium]|nr:cyclic nucleotide-binding domain-containing protein [Burkholderiales bacterium]
MEIRRSVLVAHPATAMFDLIEQAEHYPQFLPWCVGATILERSDDWVAARIEFSYLKFRFGFRTRNPKQRPHWLHVRLVEGPFKHFHGDWKLTPLGDAGCRIDFDLSYEVADGVFDRLARTAVDHVAGSMLDAFVRRADATLTSAAPSFAPAQGVAAASAQTAAIEPEVVMDKTTLIEAVRASRLAQDLDADEVGVLAALVAEQHYRSGDVIAREGQVDSRLFVIVEGSLALVKSLGTPEQSQLVTLSAGDFVHELGFIDGSQRYATLTAASDARLLMLERAKLESLITGNPRVLYRVMCSIIRAVHDMQRRMAMQASELTNYIVKQHGRY